MSSDYMRKIVDLLAESETTSNRVKRKQLPQSNVKMHSIRESYNSDDELEKTSDDVNPVDTIFVDIVTMVRLLELAREEISTDEDLHRLASAIADVAADGHLLTMGDYDSIITRYNIEQD